MNGLCAEENAIVGVAVANTTVLLPAFCFDSVCIILSAVHLDIPVKPGVNAS